MIYIEVDKIKNHPQNARKDLGDLTELAESIRQNGILQNLTVVPNPDDEDEYFAVIGNRRLAASKLAGLEKVPCVISDMDEAEQIKTMLLENMQRSDLTALEQAQGFQLMMDLGNLSVAEISEQTGFSTTTIRHRLKLNELDPEVLKEKDGSAITMADLIKLENIKSIDDKNMVLRSIGTNNFEWNYQNIINRQKKKEREEKIIDLLEENGLERITDVANKKFVKYVYDSNAAEDFVANMDSNKYYFRGLSFSGVDIYRDPQEEDIDEENARQKYWDTQRAHKEQFRQLYQTMVAVWKDFIKNVPASSLSAIKLQKYILNKVIFNRMYIDSNCVFELLGFDEKKEGFNGEEAIQGLNLSQTTRALLFVKFSTLKPMSYEMPYIEYDSTYSEHKCVTLRKFYDFMEELGYELSDDERAILDGTHEIYVKE